MVYNSFSMGVKYIKTSELVACNCKSFTYGFLVFRPIKNRKMKLKSNKSYISITKSSNSDNIPHTNMIQDSFKIEAKVMETSDSMACQCSLFTHEFIGFRPIEDMEIKLKSNTSYMSFPTSSKSYNIPRTNLV